MKLDVRTLSNTKMEKLLIEASKCDLFCANCHREIHYPDCDLTNIENILSNVPEKKTSKNITNKRKCIDCGDEINYRSKRCVNCKGIKDRKVMRPSCEKLFKEIDESNYVNVGRKYGVSDNTIRKWVKYYNKYYQIYEHK